VDTSLSDRDLWKLAGDGDADAFGVIFDRHARAVYNHCFRRTASWASAEDLTSMVFLEAWRRRTEVALEAESALPWLLGVANHVMSHRRRTFRRHRAALARLPPPLRPPDLADEVATRVDDEHTMRRLHRAVARLPRRDQEVLALCVWAGLDYASAAATLGIPVGTVRSRLSRARTRLAGVLGLDKPPQPFVLKEETP
jgi:RNA polymerase sigma factor (sigma-70 family)